MIEPTDVSAYTIAKEMTGDGMRWRELVQANPQKTRGVSGGFQVLTPGETLCIPASWAESADARGLEIDDAVGFEESDDAGAVLPLGWTTSDAKIVESLASLWNVSVDDVLVTFYEESGLQPHKMTDVGSATAPDGRPKLLYGGLIGGLAEMWNGTRRVYVIDESFGWPKGTWEKIVTETPIPTQLQAIAQIWDRQFKTYLGKLTLRQFAEKMGVTPAAVIHAVNFLPARVAGLETADSPITKAGQPGGFYEGNAGPKFGPSWGLDVDHDGAISLRDLEAHGQAKLAELEKSGIGSILASARNSPRPPDALAALFAPIATQWQSLTGKPPITTVGWNEPPSSGVGGAGGVLLAAGLAFGLWYFTKKG
jgi:hypothetical protein